MDDVHPGNIRDEFTRQAEPMASAAAFHAEPVLRWLVNAVGSASAQRVLDLACGPGIVAQALSAQVGAVVGVDATPAMVRLANERFEKAGQKNDSFSVAWAEALPFQNHVFDQVVTRLSLHHFRDLPAALAEIRRVLRPGGQLVVADVVTSERPDESRLHNALEQLRDPTHVQMFPPTGLLNLLRAAGMDVQRTDTYQQERSFPEWAAIIADPARTGPLEEVMRVLARSGQTAGISLREESGRLLFAHTWLLLVAKYR